MQGALTDSLGPIESGLTGWAIFLLHVANENAHENAYQSARESPGTSPECQDCARRNNNSPRPDPALDSEDFVARRCPINWFIRPPNVARARQIIRYQPNLGHGGSSLTPPHYSFSRVAATLSALRHAFAHFRVPRYLYNFARVGFK